MEVSPSPKPLVGTAGNFIHHSPDGRYEIRKGVMVNFPAAAIVNATTLSMSLNTASVPGAKLQIRQGGGPDMITWLQARLPNGLPVGEAVASPSFELASCRHVIHTNVPNYRGRTRATVPLLRQQLVDCYRRCLEEAFMVGAESVAFPCLGAGLVLGWRRKDVSRLGLNTVRMWFKHPLHGEERRKRIPGPIYFLADPVGPYEHQVDAWIGAFDEMWPPTENPSIPPSFEELGRSPTMTIRAKKRQHKQNPARRGGTRRGQITRIHVHGDLYPEESQNRELEQQIQQSLLDEEEQQQSQAPESEQQQDSVSTLIEERSESHFAEPQTGAEEAQERSPKRRRIGMRELKSLSESSSGKIEPEGTSRDRKAPHRYGFDEVE
ncbi:hypothetical protein VTL71DRAFT_10458 [Oculimacula yallundae]|uniref:Macro domain-containing protein n=1 Tax=Oculimacula yallundae TaxID=86028 RepID=A0ABR4CT23_9HELO